ncbi:Glycerol-3-phosphate dehydrogenase NAD+, chloroplastic [Hondaea fermentalgiana]|uniref:Glycerol-3-phosphate dehydrogenase [NAD(+)] n=1 Tax=Hondaea fermentalgiana TaxID=2315210 RepID=A0A2R5G5Y9_9STRA|nr:Glycerol-3-phosphate dehydrogenase NAD+, chloroplastic [Hondaea fermentalgiana]|eukprot:GBG25188.1 Glycerol-3-phosphate dehydrogenase NAD+, chloroplastic [Hondaea fermentalgiana]
MGDDGAKNVLLAMAFLTAGASLGALASILMTQKARREKRRAGRAFTPEDTTAIAFHIAKLSQQLALEQQQQQQQHQKQGHQQEPSMAYPLQDGGSSTASEAVSSGEPPLASAETVDGTQAQVASLVEQEGSKDELASNGKGASQKTSASTQKVAESPSEVARKRRGFVETAKAVLERETEIDQYRRNDDVDAFADVLSVYRTQYQNWRKGKHRGATTTHERMLTKGLTRHLSHVDPADIDTPELSRSSSKDSLTTHLWQQLNLGPSNASQKPVKITVVGGGAYGTAMAAAAARNGHNVIIYVRRRELAREIKLTRRNDQYLPGHELPGNVSATVDLKEALLNTELIIHALPAQRSPDWIREHRDLIPPNVLYCSTAKGLHLATQSLLSTAMLEAFGRPQPFAVLSGPSFAKEIVAKQPTSVVVASKQLADAVKIQRLMSSTTFRIYASQDTVGVELGGALKNPLAIGAGLIEGLGFGINTMSAYVTRSSAELTSLAIAMGGKPETIAGLSGIGDLMLTAFGDLSRNRSCGVRLVKGESLEEILASTTVEGVPTAKVAVAFTESCNLHLPIFRTVNNILSGKLKPEDFVVTAMMTRPLSTETHVSPLSEVESSHLGKQCIL